MSGCQGVSSLYLVEKIKQDWDTSLVISQTTLSRYKNISQVTGSMLCFPGTNWVVCWDVTKLGYRVTPSRGNTEANVRKKCSVDANFLCIDPGQYSHNAEIIVHIFDQSPHPVTMICTSSSNAMHYETWKRKVPKMGNLSTFLYKICIFDFKYFFCVLCIFLLSNIKTWFWL